MSEGAGRPNLTLINLRQDLGHSQESYADLVGATARQVRNWESGHVLCPQTWHLTRMHRLHGTTTPEQLGFKSRRGNRRPATVRAADQTEDDVFRRDFLGLVTAAAFSGRPLNVLSSILSQPDKTPHVGKADLSRILQKNATLTSADFLIGGAAFRTSALTDEFRRSAAVLYGRFAHDETRTAMHSAVGHLGSTIGFMLFDQGRHAEARKVYTTSLRIAQDATDRWPLRAIIFSEMARQCLHLGDHTQCDELLRMSRGAERQVSPTFHAMLHAVQATAQAAAGNVARTREYITLAEDTIARATPANDPSWIQWFDAAELDGETGAALARLAMQHEEMRDEAATRLARSAHAHGPADQRSKALALTRLAGIHAVRHDADEAAAVSRQVAYMATHLRSPRVSNELAILRQHLQPLVCHGDVAEVDHELATLA